MNGAERTAAMAQTLGYAELRCIAVAAVGGLTMDPADVVRVAVRTAAAARTLEDDAVIAAELVRRVRAITLIEMRAARHERRPSPPWARPFLLAGAHLDWLDEVTHVGGLAMSLPLAVPGVFPAVVQLTDLVSRERARKPRTSPGDTRPLGRPR